MWILSIGTIVAILAGIFALQSVEYADNHVAHALFFALQRNSWGIAIAWIVFSCEMGYGGVLKKFLELPIWIPFGRMSLSFYLVHGLYFSVHVGSNRVPANFNDFQLVRFYLICNNFL
jgi:peptidoglycan/LPS O-acetylase OafA/YrhL